MGDIHGVIVVDANMGRALRLMPAAIKAADVIGCSGEFRAGDPVYVTMRGADGGQYAIAVGRAEIDSATLLARIGAAGDAGHELAHLRDAVAAEGMRVLWRVPV